MDETRLNAILSILSTQRNQALDAVAQLQAEIIVLKEEVSQLTQQLQARDDMSHLAPAPEVANG